MLGFLFLSFLCTLVFLILLFSSIKNTRAFYLPAAMLDTTNKRGSYVIPQYLDASHHPVVRALAASIVLMLHQPPTTRWKGLMHHLYKGLVGCGSQKLPATRPVVHWANDAGVHRGSQRDQPATTSAPAPSQGGVGQWKWSSRKGGSDMRRQRWRVTPMPLACHCVCRLSLCCAKRNNKRHRHYTYSW